jgi:hypothetical protein
LFVSRLFFVVQKYNNKKGKKGKNLKTEACFKTPGHFFNGVLYSDKQTNRHIDIGKTGKKSNREKASLKIKEHFV